MRDILFRGKRIDNGEWVYGYLVREDFYTGENPDKFIIMCRDVDYGVIPETVGQYTGLKDKEGNKIFEGDIIEFDKDIELEGKRVFEVKYTQYYWYPFQFLMAHAYDCTIKGNIHDNPELLQ